MIPQATRPPALPVLALPSLLPRPESSSPAGLNWLIFNLINTEFQELTVNDESTTNDRFGTKKSEDVIREINNSNAVSVGHDVTQIPNVTFESILSSMGDLKIK